MFERRLKIVLLLLSTVIVALIFRAIQVQVIQKKYWRQVASEELKKTRFLDTTRGRIVDRWGRELAVDRACEDACVDYHAIESPADPKWLHDFALARLKSRFGDAWLKIPKKERATLLTNQQTATQKDLDAMWGRLAKLSGTSLDDIEQTRQSILQRVQMRKRYIWFQGYQQALKSEPGDSSADAESKFEKWLNGDMTDGPEIDRFVVTVSDEMVPHVILHAINLDVQNELARHIEKYPGLVLRPGTHRYYPYENVACHLIGYLGRVNRDDLKGDPNPRNPRRQYLLNDQIGRQGLEWLCEPALRGVLGQVVTTSSEDNSASLDQPVPGQTVKTSIDVELQQEIQNFFTSATLHDVHGKVIEQGAVLYGAAVLLKVDTNEVLALVSNPSYNLNEFDENFQNMYHNEVDQPLRNRATESKFEPGSTVKPLVGLSGITQGVIKVNEGIECTGKLMLPDPRTGKIVTLPWGRCWVDSMYHELLHGQVAHHPVPTDAPHRGHDGNQDGFLTYSDGLERSCNVYFENVANRLGMDSLSAWMSKWGLGRKTGIGIEEARGYVPAEAVRGSAIQRWSTCFLGGIGQGHVAATPIQMANVAATIARGGIWMRPRILIPAVEGGNTPPVQPAVFKGPDQIDLHLDRAALAACKLGMINVVNGPAGTGKAAHMNDLLVAGKTGTAQGSPFKLLKRDHDRKPMRDANNNYIYRTFALSTPEHPNKEMPWYRGSGQNFDKVDHAWMIGFAPADKPQVAFGVLVEYGGSGGGAAADVVKVSLEACIEHGYLHAQKQPPVPIEPQASANHHDDDDD